MKYISKYIYLKYLKYIYKILLKRRMKFSWAKKVFLIIGETLKFLGARLWALPPPSIAMALWHYCPKKCQKFRHGLTLTRKTQSWPWLQRCPKVTFLERTRPKPDTLASHNALLEQMTIKVILSPFFAENCRFSKSHSNILVTSSLTRRLGRLRPGAIFLNSATTCLAIADPLPEIFQYTLFL